MDTSGRDPRAARAPPARASCAAAVRATLGRRPSRLNDSSSGRDLATCRWGGLPTIVRQLELERTPIRGYCSHMLILTRRPQEAIRIGEEVTITVLGVEGNK